VTRELFLLLLADVLAGKLSHDYPERLVAERTRLSRDAVTTSTPPFWRPFL
jgi:hypothetical protein